MLARCCLLAATGLLALACDTRATARPGPSAPVLAEGGAHELESCTVNADCATGLHCVAQTCVRQARSILGDYRAAVGRAGQGKGDLTAARRAFADALAQYDQERVEAPIDLVCEYGATLASDQGRRESVELAARVLHRCVLAATPGSATYVGALDRLASLAVVGLDPQLIARPQAADAYLTLSAAPVAPVAPSVALTANPAVTARTYPLLAARLGGPETTPQLLACFASYTLAGGAAPGTVTLGLRSRYVAEYEDEPGRYVLATDAPAVATGPTQALGACVRAALDASLTKNPGVRDSFSTRLTIEFR